MSLLNFLISSTTTRRCLLSANQYVKELNLNHYYYTNINIIFDTVKLFLKFFQNFLSDRQDSNLRTLAPKASEINLTPLLSVILKNVVLN